MGVTHFLYIFRQANCDLPVIIELGAFDCKGVIRIDYIIDKSDGSLYINEINTIPGSFAFYLWEASGLSYESLLDELIEYAVKAFEDSSRSEYAYKSDILLNYKKGAKAGLKGAKYSGKG